MLTKQLAKEAAIIMCKQMDFEVIKVGRWKRCEYGFKRGFICVKKRNGVGGTLIEIRYDVERNLVSCVDFFFDGRVLADFIPGRAEYDDEIEMELKEKFGSNPAIEAGLENPTKDQAIERGIRIINDLNFKINYMGKWHGSDKFGFIMAYTNRGNLFINLMDGGVITIERNGKYLASWKFGTLNTCYSKMLQSRAQLTLENMFDNSDYIFTNVTGWTADNDCMVAYLVMFNNLSKYKGKAILTSNGNVDIYCEGDLVMSGNCSKEGY